MGCSMIDSSMNGIFSLKSFLRIVLFFTIGLFAAQENKEKEVDLIQYDELLTKELDELIQSNCSWDEYEELVGRAHTLISNGADPNIQDGNVLFCNFMNNNIPFIKTCLARRARIDIVEPFSGIPLLFFVYSCKAIELLLNSRANVDVRQALGTTSEFKDWVGATVLHFTSISEGHSLEAVERWCEHIPAGSILLDDAGRTPLHYVCMGVVKGKEGIKNFLVKVATLAWWAAGQEDVRDIKTKQTARDLLNKTCSHVVNYFDEVVREVELARTQLLPDELALSLKGFKKAFNQRAVPIIEEQIGCSKGILNIIMGYTGNDIPRFPYPSLIYQENDDVSKVLGACQCTGKGDRTPLPVSFYIPPIHKPKKKRCLIS